MATIPREGVTIYYEHHQSKAPASVPTILLSHGYSATSAMWKGQIEPLTEVANLVIWDMRGHGMSDSPEDPALYSEAHTVADMAALLDECNAASAIVGGLSLGGYMTLAFHLAHPDRCRALMLFDTGPGYKNPEARKGWNDTAGQRAKAFEEKGLGALGASSEVRASSHRSTQGLAHAARGMLAQVDDRIIQSLTAIQAPVLALVGEKDTPFLIPTDYMANKIAGAQKVVLAGAGHASNIDQPAAFNSAVLAFIRSLS